jgi:hypothetical protein
VSKLLADRDQARARYPINRPFNLLAEVSLTEPAFSSAGAEPTRYLISFLLSYLRILRAGAGMLRSATSSSTFAVRTQTGLSVHCLIL